MSANSPPKHTRNDMCDLIERYAHRKGFPNIRCYVVEFEWGGKEYAICDDKEWLYANSSSEAIAAHIDMMKLVEDRS